MRVRLLLIAGLTLACFVAPSSYAMARSCSLEGGKLVLNGKSPGGVPWDIRACREGKSGFLHFSLKSPPAYPGVGYSAALRLPVRPAFLFTATGGSDLSPSPESDVSGLASARVATLRLEMTNGSVLEFQPATARKGARKHHPWVRRLRFFDYFFAASLTPAFMTALDAQGQVLERRQSMQGSFL
jgi:hypothetical protein